MELREAVRQCSECQGLVGVLFVDFQSEWPHLPEPPTQPVLFISEAPPMDGGFWAIQPPGKRKDGLRGNVLDFLNIDPAHEPAGLEEFVGAGLYLIQSFQRPLKFSVAGLSADQRKEMLQHQVHAHLKPQIDYMAPRAILALGETAATAVSLVFPASSFSHMFERGGFRATKGQIIAEEGVPLLSATYLPAGPSAGFFKRSWQAGFQAFLDRAKEVRSLSD